MIKLSFDDQEAIVDAPNCGEAVADESRRLAGWPDGSTIHTTQTSAVAWLVMCQGETVTAEVVS